MRTLISTLLARPVKAAAQCLLALTIMGWVVAHCGPPGGEVVVHVVEADVEVTIGGNAYQFEGRPNRPIVCELPHGRHELVMRRGGRVVYEEAFDLGRGESRVLTAFDSERYPAFGHADPAGPEPKGPAPRRLPPMWSSATAWNSTGSSPSRSTTASGTP